MMVEVEFRLWPCTQDQAVYAVQECSNPTLLHSLQGFKQVRELLQQLGLEF